jgi:hypothetical protein
MRDRHWYPQGITTSADASADGLVDGRRVVVVSWYAKQATDDPFSGSRLTFVDITDRAAPRYRHVALVQRGLEDRIRSTIAPVRLHVGGIAWLGDSMLVADTRGGIRVFAVDDIRRGIDTVTGAECYLLPQRSAYRAENPSGVEPFRFSFLSVDRTSRPNQLVVGEYATGAQTRRLMTLALGSDPLAPLASVDGVAVATSIEDGVARTQGALVVDGRRYAAVGRGVHLRGSMWTWWPGERPREHRAALAVGPEDLSFWPQCDEIWGASEEPGRRFVYAVHRAAFDVG